MEIASVFTLLSIYELCFFEGLHQYLPTLEVLRTRILGSWEFTWILHLGQIYMGTDVVSAYYSCTIPPN